MQSNALIKDRMSADLDAGFDAVWEQAACMNIQLDNVSEALLRSDKGWLSGAKLIERLRQIQQMQQPPTRELSAADDPGIRELAALVEKSYTWARGAVQLTMADPLFQFAGTCTRAIYFVSRRPLLLTHQPFAKWHRLIPVQVATFDLSQIQVQMYTTVKNGGVHPHVTSADGFFCTGSNATAMSQAIHNVRHNVHGLRAALHLLTRICETITEGYEFRINSNTHYAFTQLPQAVRARVTEINNESSLHWTRPIIELPKEAP